MSDISWTLSEWVYKQMTQKQKIVSKNKVRGQWIWCTFLHWPGNSQMNVKVFGFLSYDFSDQPVSKVSLRHWYTSRIPGAAIYTPTVLAYVRKWHTFFYQLTNAHYSGHFLRSVRTNTHLRIWMILKMKDVLTCVSFHSSFTKKRKA